ncbi:MAG TPA: SusC/RagA family TonB-linked outer membrane protein [Puia sp.]|jgi:TonB-linked SusC/RagA family outer membrane protein|nr:SusC/RagA family TonB-linked outer membrane protein [Puia sp.]
MRKIVFMLLVLMLPAALVFSQAKLVAGKITDQTGAAVPFATVHIKGSKLGVAADADGNFEIKAKPGDVLTVSGTGFAAKEITVDNSGTALSVVVSRKESNLTEVVVTALGIRKENKALGYSTATVNNEALNIAKPVNVEQGLIGQVSGAQVSIINNGVDPQIRIQLRGERHITSDNEPLYIVDGQEVDQSFIITLNPEDIESTSILKSASAAALYGSEATNGVIIITTKKGARNNKPIINFSQTGTLEKVAYLPKLQNQFGGYGGENGVYLAGTPWQFTAINPYTGYTNYIPFENQQYGPQFTGQPSFIGIPNQYGQVDSVPYAPQSKNPIQQFMKTGFTSQTDASLATGDAKNGNFVGVQYVDVKGVVPQDQSQRASIRFNGKRTIGNTFWYDYFANYSYKYSNVVGNDITLGWPIYWTLLNTPANIPIASLKDWQDPKSFGNLSNYYNAYYINPWWQVQNSRNIGHSDNIQGAFDLNLKPVDWFLAQYRVSAQVSNSIFKGYRNAATFTPYAIAATGPSSGIYGTPSSGNISGALVDETLLTKRIQQDITATFQQKFGDIGATLIVGNTIWDRSSNQQVQNVGNNVGAINGVPINSGSPQSQKSGLVLPGVYNIGFEYGIPTVSGYISDERLIGYYGDLTLSYNDLLFLHGNYRKDYSSLLAPAHNNYSVYGGDASLIVTDLFPALKSSNVLSYAKLRGAYSHTGQITLAPYSTTNTFNVAANYPYGGLAGLSLSGTYNNPANTPEATNEVEGGIEAGFVNGRILAGVTYYHDNNYNQLFPVTLTTATGYSAANVNAANTVSKGWEFDLKTNPVHTRTVRWDLNANLAIQTTTVVSLYGTGSNKTLQTGIGNNNEAIVGMVFPQLYVSDLVRDPANGKIVVSSATGLPTLSTSLVPAGRTTPKYILGLTSTVTAYNFTLQVIADYRGGYVFYNSAEKSLDFTGATTHTTENGRQNMVFPNSEIQVSPGKYAPNTNVYVPDGNIGFWVYSQFTSAGTSYVENAAAWKVRTINLTYDFGKLIAGQKVLHGLTLSAIVNNALMFRPKENNFTDPEFNYSNANGLGNNTYYQLPPTRQWTLVAKFNF